MGVAQTSVMLLVAVCCALAPTTGNSGTVTLDGTLGARGPVAGPDFQLGARPRPRRRPESLLQLRHVRPRRRRQRDVLRPAKHATHHQPLHRRRRVLDRRRAAVDDCRRGFLFRESRGRDAWAECERGCRRLVLPQHGALPGVRRRRALRRGRQHVDQRAAHGLRVLGRAACDHDQWGGDCHASGIRDCAGWRRHHDRRRPSGAHQRPLGSRERARQRPG